MAKAASVSRQAVSLWFGAEGDFRNVHVANLLNLGAGLGVAPAELLQPLPGLAESRRGEAVVRGILLGPFLSRTSIRFLVALAAGRPRAVARLIECRGIYEAAAVLGATGVGRLSRPPLAVAGLRDAPWSMPCGRFTAI